MKDRALVTGILVTSAVVGYAVFDLPLGWTMVALVVGLPIAGLLITIDDEMPGGWGNPDGKRRPLWHYGEFWGEILLRLSLSFVGFAIDRGWNTGDAAGFWIAAAIGAALGISAMKRWPVPQHDG